MDARLSLPVRARTIVLMTTALLVIMLALVVVGVRPAQAVDITTALDQGGFSTLGKALAAAGLVDTLKGERTVTIFAPTDAAFSSLGTKLDELLANPTGELADTLKNHVIVGKKLAAADITGDQSVETLGGKVLKITKDDGGIKVDGIKVSTPDIAIDNGVVHGIDGVIPLAAATTTEDEGTDWGWLWWLLLLLIPLGLLLWWLLRRKPQPEPAVVKEPEPVAKAEVPEPTVEPVKTEAAAATAATAATATKAAEAAAPAGDLSKMLAINPQLGKAIKDANLPGGFAGLADLSLDELKSILTTPSGVLFAVTTLGPQRLKTLQSLGIGDTSDLAKMLPDDFKKKLDEAGVLDLDPEAMVEQAKLAADPAKASTFDSIVKNISGLMK